MEKDLKTALLERLRQVGAYDARVANPHVGFEHALEGKHPLHLWPDCKSVVIFNVAMSPLTNNTYLGPASPWNGERQVGPVPNDIASPDYAMDRLSRLFAASVTLKGIVFLQAQGYNTRYAMTQFKLCAHEAGLGVYGRSGVIIHPMLGNRMNLGAILTDAPLDPDPQLQEFHPCQDCDLCIRACPAQAFDPEKDYPHSWSREKCTSKRAEIAKKGLYCHNCFASCPAGQLKDEDLFVSKEAVSFYKPRKERG